MAPRRLEAAPRHPAASAAAARARAALAELQKAEERPAVVGQLASGSGEPNSKGQKGDVSQVGGKKRVHS